MPLAPRARSVPLLVPAALIAAMALPAPAATVPDNFVDERAVTVGSGAPLDHPVAMAFLPDGRLLVAEQMSARIRLFVNGTLAAVDPVATLPGIRNTGGEQGLLGIAIDPRWPARPYLYIHCDDSGSTTIRISRYAVAGDLAWQADGSLTIDSAHRRDILTNLPDLASNHNGGTLRFGPDSMLYVSLGDDMDHCAAQDTSVPVGKILRLDVSRVPDGPGPAPSCALITPADNPFVAAPDSSAHLVWAFGLRNPYRFGIDPDDGALFIGDVGETAWEEVDRVSGGGHNLGWPLYEGPAYYGLACPNALSQGDAPIYAYDRVGITSAVIGGAVYRRPAGTPMPFPTAFEGDFFFSDYYQGFLRRLKGHGGAWALADSVSGQPSAEDWGRGFDEVSDWGVGPDGALWYCRQSVFYTSNSGDIRRVRTLVTDAVAPPAPAASARFAPPRPSPARDRVTFRYALPARARTGLDVFDVTGRRVRALEPPNERAPGDHEVPWDARDDAGARVPPGVYLARLTVDGASLERRVPIVR